MVDLSEKTLPFTSLFFLAAIRICASETFGVYWGFASENEVSLTETCLSGRYRYVNIYRLTGFGNGRTPVLDIGSHCNASSPNGCTHLSSDIKICQDMGIKVMLSIGGADDAGYSRASADDTKNVSLYLWNAFLGGRSSSYPRPLGNATLDGIDLYQSYNRNLPVRLVEPYNGTNRYYLSTALSCSFWSSGIPVAYSINSSVFNYISIEFFGESCAYYPGKADNVFSTWNLWALHLNVTLFLGLAATPNISVGFVPADVLVSEILPVVKRSSNYGGMMLWSKSVDDKTGYSSSIENLSIDNGMKSAAVELTRFVNLSFGEKALFHAIWIMRTRSTNQRQIDVLFIKKTTGNVKQTDIHDQQGSALPATSFSRKILRLVH